MKKYLKVIILIVVSVITMLLLTTSRTNKDITFKDERYHVSNNLDKTVYYANLKTIQQGIRVPVQIKNIKAYVTTADINNKLYNTPENIYAFDLTVISENNIEQEFYVDESMPYFYELRHKALGLYSVIYADEVTITKDNKVIDKYLEMLRK